MSIYRSLNITVSFLGPRKTILRKETLIVETTSVGFALDQWIIDRGLPAGSCLVYYDGNSDQYRLIIRPGMRFTIHSGTLFLQGSGGSKSSGKNQKSEMSFQDFIAVPCPPGTTATICTGRYAFECRFLSSGEKRSRKTGKLPPFTSHHFFPTSRWPEHARADWNRRPTARNLHDAWHVLGVNGSPLEVLTRLFHDFTPEMPYLIEDPGLAEFRSLLSRLPDPSVANRGADQEYIGTKKKDSKTVESKK